MSLHYIIYAEHYNEYLKNSSVNVSLLVQQEAMWLSTHHSLLSSDRAHQFEFLKARITKFITSLHVLYTYDTAQLLTPN